MKEKLQKKGIYYAPEGYWKLSKEDKKKIKLNKCGGDKITATLVPDYILGVDISEVCNVHDYMYLKGETAEDKKRAEKIFYDNLQVAVNEKKGNGFVRFLRRGIASIYAKLASLLGHFYFKKKK